MQVRAAGLRITLFMFLTALAASVLALLRRADSAVPVAAVAVAAPAWVAATGDGAAPAGYPVKVKDRSGILHEPGGRFYERTNPDRWYADRAAAEADGYRAPKGL